MPNDIRIHTGFPDHPKVQKLIRKCGAEAALCLLRLWGWCAQNRPKGTLTNMDSDDIEIVAGWRGAPGELFQAIEGIWVEKNGEWYEVHDWEENQPWVYHAEARAARAKAAAKKRWASRDAAGTKSECAEHTGGTQDAMPSGNAPSPSPSPSPTPNVLKDLFDKSNDPPAKAPDFYLTRNKRKLQGKRLEAFELFWEAFDYKRGKSEAADAWLDIPELTDPMVDTICKAAAEEARCRPNLVKDGFTPKMAQGWLTARRWEDEVHVPPGAKTPDDGRLNLPENFFDDDYGGPV